MRDLCIDGREGMSAIMNEKLLKHSILLSAAVSVILGAAAAFLFLGEGDSFMEGVIVCLMIGIFAIYPFILTLINFAAIFCGCTDPRLIRKGRHFEWITLVLGVLYSLLLLDFTDFTFSDWTVTLHNAQKHTPIWTEGALTVLIFAAVGILGYLFLSCSRISKVPPLITVLEIAAMYLGMLQCILWVIQIIRLEAVYLYLCLFPLNCILIGIKVIRQKMIEWGKTQCEEVKKDGSVNRFRNRYLDWMNRHLERSSVWPAAAFLLMWPLLGIIICVLLLFGQRPDSAVRAWT